jgi:NAD(P)-dependent dehydrogenase (short-subunit alcohol dehydrogenase family)
VGVKLEDIFRLDKKVIVITGAAGLLGRKHAEAIAAFGGTPVLLDIDHDETEQLARELTGRYRVPAVGVTVDITHEKEIEDNAGWLIERFGKIDGLVNNAANNPKVETGKGKDFSRLENFPLEVWNNDLAVGLTGAFLCAKHYGARISENELGGSIVNISSDLGLIAPDQRLYREPGLPEEKQPVKPIAYSIVKTGLIGLTRYLSTYWPKKVRCNALCPGGVQAGQKSEFSEELSSRIPQGRLAQPNEYQGALIFLLSAASSYLNGALIPMDGGRNVW